MISILEGLSTYPRFETEARGNYKMAYSIVIRVMSVTNA